MPASLDLIPVAKLAGVYLPDRMGRARSRGVPSYYARHPVKHGPQPMIRVHKEGSELRILDFLTVLPANAPTVAEPVADSSTNRRSTSRKALVVTDALLSAVFRYLDEEYATDISDHDANNPYFKIGTDANKPPFRSSGDEKLFRAVDELLLAERPREATFPALRVRSPIALRTNPNFAELRRRIAAAKERNPRLADSLRDVTMRLRSWTPYNLQEGRVALSKKQSECWRIFSLWNKWETSDAKWLARLIMLRPGAEKLGEKAQKAAANSLARFCARHGLVPAHDKRK